MFSQEDALILHGKSLNPECVIGDESDADTDDGSIFEEFEDLPKKMLASQICQQCENMFQDWDRVIASDEDIIFPHHNSFAALEISTERGCGLCKQFLQTNSVQDIRDA